MKVEILTIIASILMVVTTAYPQTYIRNANSCNLSNPDLIEDAGVLQNSFNFLCSYENNVPPCCSGLILNCPMPGDSTHQCIDLLIGSCCFDFSIDPLYVWLRADQINFSWKDATTLRFFFKISAKFDGGIHFRGYSCFPDLNYTIHPGDGDIATADLTIEAIPQIYQDANGKRYIELAVTAQSCDISYLNLPGIQNDIDDALKGFFKGPLCKEINQFHGNLVDYLEPFLSADLIDSIVSNVNPSPGTQLSPGQTINVSMSFKNVADHLWFPPNFGTAYWSPTVGSVLNTLPTSIPYGGTASFSFQFTAPYPDECGAPDSYPILGNMWHNLNGSSCGFGDHGSTSIKVSRPCEPGEEPCDMKVCSICLSFQFLSINEKRDLELLRNFRDDVLLKGPGGAYFTQLYYKFSPEISKILKTNPGLLLQSINLIREYLPFVKSIVNNNGTLPPGLAQKTLTDEEIQNIELFIMAIHEHAGPELKEFLEFVRDLLHEFGKIPLGIGLKTLIHGNIMPEKAQGKAWGIIKMIETVPTP